MTEEKQFKKLFINKLNNIYKGWRDGDLDNFNGSKIDIVNDNLKIAIEIKDDFRYKSIVPALNGQIVSQTTNLSKKINNLKIISKKRIKKLTIILNIKA